jgi:formylglycine-generating enzyme required for sulfatase activity
MRALARGGAIAAILAACACTLTHPLDELAGGACRIDGVKNGRETAIDCGGGCSARCDVGQACLVGTDCQTGTCVPLPSGGSVCGCADDMAEVRPITAGLSSFCIDRTEVTSDAYAQLLTACSTPPCHGVDLPAVCSGKTSFAPDPACASSIPAEQRSGSYPVACVDWCDAFAYCAFVGKRLCGPEAAREAAATEWVNACLDGSADNAYPYGAAYDPCRCNGIDFTQACWGGPTDPPASRVQPVETAAACHGRAPIYDLSGNVWEWQLECRNPGMPTSDCTVRGGAFDSNADQLRCKAADSRSRLDGWGDVGFRCCSG